MDMIKFGGLFFAWIMLQQFDMEKSTVSQEFNFYCEQAS